MREPVVREAWTELGGVEASANRFDISPNAVPWGLLRLSLVADRPVSDPVPTDQSSLDV
jgi:hypothetical protein